MRTIAAHESATGRPEALRDFRRRSLPKLAMTPPSHLQRSGLFLLGFCERRVPWFGTWLILVSLISAACGAARPNKYYQLTVPADPIADPPAGYQVSILLGPLQASHLYHEDHIVYSSASENMGTYEYQRWAEPPIEMIQEVLFRHLRASGRYRSVYSLRSNAHGDFVLHGHLYDFKELTGPNLSARLTMELELRDVKTGNAVWNHFYSHDEPVATKDVSAVVAALNKNVQRAVAEFQSSLDHYFSAHPPAATTP